MTASTKSQRITKDCQITFPCWLWYIHGPGIVGRWFHIEEWEPITLNATPEQCGYTHWHPDQPDAPQEVPTLETGIANQGSSRPALQSEESHDTDSGLQDNPAPKTEHSVLSSPAPSKETIAPTPEDIVCEVLAREAENEDDRQVAKRILRALDRAGGAKGVDTKAEIPEELHGLIGLSSGEPTAEELAEFTEATRAYWDWKRATFKKAWRLPLAKIAWDAGVEWAKSAPRPPASVDAGTPRTDDLNHNEDERPINHTLQTLAGNPMPGVSLKEWSQFVNRVLALTAQLSSLAVQLEEAKKEVHRWQEVVGPVVNAQKEPVPATPELVKSQLDFWREEYKDGEQLASALAEKEKEAQTKDYVLKTTGALLEVAKSEMVLMQSRLAALEEDKRRLERSGAIAKEFALAALDFPGIRASEDSAIAQWVRRLNAILKRHAALSSENPRTLREGEEK